MGRSVEAADRRRRAVALALAGLPYSAIATEVGYANKGTAHRAVWQALHEQAEDDVRALRTLEDARLDRLWQRWWPVALRAYDPQGLEATDRLLRIAERRARLFGLDAPRRVAVQTEDKMDAEIEALIADLGRLEDTTGGGGATAIEVALERMDEESRALLAGLDEAGS